MNVGIWPRSLPIMQHKSFLKDFMARSIWKIPSYVHKYIICTSSKCDLSSFLLRSVAIWNSMNGIKESEGSTLSCIEFNKLCSSDATTTPAKSMLNARREERSTSKFSHASDNLLRKTNMLSSKKKIGATAAEMMHCDAMHSRMDYRCRVYDTKTIAKLDLRMPLNAHSHLTLYRLFTSCDHITKKCLRFKH